jgi:hypothetical protein
MYLDTSKLATSNSGWRQLFFFWLLCFTNFLFIHCLIHLLLRSIVVDFNDHIVSYEKFYESLKPRGEISIEVMDAFVELFNGRFDEKKEDKKSIMKISFNPFL